MNDVREFAYKIARELSAKSIEVGELANGTHDAIDRLELRGRAVGYSGAAVMVLEAIQAEDSHE